MSEPHTPEDVGLRGRIESLLAYWTVSVPVEELRTALAETHGCDPGWCCRRCRRHAMPHVGCIL